MSTSKFFVGGLSYDTTDETLCKYFEAYGELQKGFVLKEDDRTRGFGFVTFKDSDSLPDNFLSSIHVVDGKQVDVKPAVPESEVHDIDQKGRKLVIRGLTFKTTRQDLETYFSQFGEVAHAEVFQVNGHPRGKGSVIFTTKEAADRVLNHLSEHRLNNRVLDVKRAKPKYTWSKKTPPPPAQSDATDDDSDEISHPEKIFVGGLSRHTTEDSMKEYFSVFGEVLLAEVMRREGHSRGFGFVIFAKNKAAERVVAQRRHFLDGNWVECKACDPLPPHQRLRLQRKHDADVDTSPASAHASASSDIEGPAQIPPVFSPEQMPFNPTPVLLVPERLYVAAYANALLRAIGAPAAVPYYPWGGAQFPSFPQPPANPAGQMSQYTPY